MRFALDDEQVALQRTARRVLDRWSPPDAVRAAMATERGYDPALWQRLAGELGVTALLVPDAYGGLGLGPTSLAPLMEELGRALACAPVLSTVALATNALVLGADKAQKQRWLPKIASGELTATVAFGPPADPCETGLFAFARPSGGYRILGSVAQVIDGHTADLLILPARLPRPGLSVLAVVPGDHPGIVRTVLPTMDRTRRLARIDLSTEAPVLVDVAPTELLGTKGNTHKLLCRVLARAAAALASEQVGVAERCLDMSVEYAKTRVQFGRPIGSFQAIKHRCADMLVDVESARAASWYAAWATEFAPDEAAAAASLAKAWCSEASYRAAAECIQVHGGIGFTWEHDAHIAFKRARASEALLGTPTAHRELIAAEIGL
ncbi:MAG: acyl-CoA dehydrogenase family protein [Myxococcota bacterium]